ncbi:MAG: tyrosine-type recombinase/integrase [bacterium]|nr:tyrosine-type recombinase/integrase [bacterium]
MNKTQQQRYETLYEQHVNALKRQGKSDSTIDVYSRAVRRVTAFFDRCPDKLSIDDLKTFFSSLVESHSWSTVKVDRNGLQFFYKHILGKKWEWVNIVKPPVVKSLPDILSPDEISRLLNQTKERRYQTYILTVYSMGLRLGEALNLKVGDIDSQSMRIHIRKGKGKKDRFVTLPEMSLQVLRQYWCTHRNPLFVFPAGKNTDEQHHATVHMHRGGVQKSFQAIVRSAGIHKQVSIHTLRHCYGTHLVEVGLNLRAIQTEMGHECPKTTALYTQLTETTQQNTRELIVRMLKRLTLTEED